MRRFSILWIVFPTLLLAACSDATPPVQPLPQPMEPTPVADPAYVEPDPLSAIRFSSLNIEEGLSESSPTAIIQDRQGFLWIGTQDGLNRYDGYQFKIYRPSSGNENSLSHRWITDLIEDRDGNLWIATSQGGLNRYDPRTDRFTRYQRDSIDPTSLTSDYLRCLTQDQDGMIWVGTIDGLDRLDPATGEFTHFRHSTVDPHTLSENSVTALLVDRSGAVWVGTAEAGLNRYEPTTGTFQIFRSDLANPNSLSGDMIRSIREAPDGDLWVATANEIDHLDPKTGQVMRYPISDRRAADKVVIEAITVDRGGTLWIGTRQGLYRFDEQTGALLNYHHIPSLPDTLTSNIIKTIYEDREGVLWVGAYGGGVNKYDRGQEKFKYYRHNPEDPNSLGGDAVFSLYVEPNGVRWIGTMEGLDRLDPATGIYTHFRHDPAVPTSLSDDLVWAILRDREGQLWAGTQASLDRLDEDTGQFTHFRHVETDPDSIASSIAYRIYEDHAGELWLGTANGLDRFDRATGKFVHYCCVQGPASLRDNTTISIAEDRAGYLWVGTFGSGMYRLDPERKNIAFYLSDSKIKGTLSSNSVMAIHQDQVGTLWVATTGGLNRYVPDTGSFITFTEADGLPNDVVYAILEDKQGFLWLSTNIGISRFDPDSTSFRNYTVTDGLQGNEFNQGAYAQDDAGNLYFGGIDGITIFNPLDIRDNPYFPPIVLTALTAGGKPVGGEMISPALNEITLQWPQDSLEFDFSALGFSQPQNNRYAYKLVGFDPNWNEIGKMHNGRYTNLPGGSYTLQLKASNSDGVWIDPPKAIRVKVIAPFWKTDWFYGLVGVSILGIVLGIYRLRVRTIEKQKHELERLVEERTRKIEQLFEQNKELVVIEERNRLARELHDSAKQKAFASLAELGAVNGLIHQDPTSARLHLGEAENLVSEVIQELTFLIQEMYPVALKEKGLASAVLEYIFEWETRTDIRVNSKIEGEYPLPLEIEQAAYRITQESLANVARHSRATRVDYCVFYHADTLEVSIADNGQGFSLEQKPNGIGLRTMYERAKSVGGALNVIGAPGLGTRVTFIVPVKGHKKSDGGQHD